MARRLHDDVPRLPRGRGIKLSLPLIMRIAMVGTLLVAVIVMQRPCAEAVSGFVTSLDPPDAGVAAEPAVEPAAPDPYGGAYIELAPGMTEDEIKAAVERARTGQ